jgi:DNA processing protein
LIASSGPPQLKPWIDKFGSAHAAWQVVKRAGRLSDKLSIIESRARAGLAALEAQGVEILTVADAHYPDRLRQLEADAPYALFARGRLELLQRKTLAVVGSRNCSEYGADAARLLTSAAARAGAVIASGLAIGIDGIAHQTALAAGGDTLAVLGCGIDVCYPRRHRALFNRIAADGLLLTEFAPGTPPLPYHFPHRNRIIALLAHAVLVVEATVDSGSLSTAARATPYMEVLAVPGPMGRRGSEGCNALIGDGATIVRSEVDVLTALKLKPAGPTEVSPEPSLDPQAKRVWKVLSHDGLHIDEIAQRVSLPAPAVTGCLLQLELAGQVRQLPGNRFSRVLTAS